MKKLSYQTEIKAPKDKVWKVLWDDATYRAWTSAFSEGSYAVSDWQEGSKVLFLSAEGDGMYSQIDKMIPEAYMSFRHIGVVKNGQEQPLDEETKAWSGSKENYTLHDTGNGTRLEVEVDMDESYEDFFNTTFPKALAKVKELSEQV